MAIDAYREFDDVVIKLDATTGKVQQVPQIEIGNILKAQEGLAVHLMGITLDLTLKVDSDAPTMAAAMKGEHLFSVLQGLSLRSEGHDFFDGCNLLHLHRINRMLQSNDALESVPSDIPDATASGVTRSIRTTIWFVDPEAPDDHRYDGVVPVGLFSPTRNAGNILKFSVAAAFNPGFGGVTVVDVQGDIVAHCVALDVPRLPTTQRYRMLSTQETDLPINLHGPTPWLAIADDTSDGSAFSQNMDDYSNLDVFTRGSQVYSGRDSDFFARRFNTLRHARSAAKITEASAEYVPLITPPRTGDRSKMPLGRTRVRINNRASRTSTQFILREWGRYDQGQANRWAMFLGAPSAGQGVAAAHMPIEGRPKNSPFVDQYLDHRVYWRGMEREGYTVAAAKAGPILAQAGL